MVLSKQIRLTAIESVSADVDLPGSKSITNRAFVLSALATGDSELDGVLESDDTIVMTECLFALGVNIQKTGQNRTFVTGSNGSFSATTKPLFTRNSGTTTRFLTAAAALAPAGSVVILDGIERMRQRPIADLTDALTQLGVSAETSETGCPPVHISGGGIPGGRCTIKGTISSQYLSALLMSAPYSSSGVEIVVDGGLVSKPYVDITTGMMLDFGVDIINENYQRFLVSGSQKYRGRRYAIEPDASNASYFFAAAAISGGSVTVKNLGTGSIQGDIKFVDVLEQMGCTVIRRKESITVTGNKLLRSIDFDASEIPDTAQTIAVTACFAEGTTTLSGLRSLRVKETDRIAAMAAELRKIGAVVTEGDEFLVIQPPKQFKSATIETYDDHRMAMSFAVMGLKVDNLTINDPECVAKSFPDFWNRWSKAFPGSVAIED